jgi:hypothetical protein
MQVVKRRPALAVLLRGDALGDADDEGPDDRRRLL